MSAISSFSSAMNVYQPQDRNSLAHSAEAVAGAQEAFAEGEMPHEGHHYREEHQDDETAFPSTEPDDTTISPPTNNLHHVLDVTA
jgi:hypothetical protein